MRFGRALIAARRPIFCLILMIGLFHLAAVETAARSQTAGAQNAFAIRRKAKTLQAKGGSIRVREFYKLRRASCKTIPCHQYSGIYH